MSNLHSAYLTAATAAVLRCTYKRGEMRRWHQRLATLYMVAFSTAVVPVLGALSRDQHLDYDEELARLCVVRCSVTYTNRDTSRRLLRAVVLVADRPCVSAVV